MSELLQVQGKLKKVLYVNSNPSVNGAAWCLALIRLEKPLHGKLDLKISGKFNLHKNQVYNFTIKNNQQYDSYDVVYYTLIGSDDQESWASFLADNLPTHFDRSLLSAIVDEFYSYKTVFYENILKNPSHLSKIKSLSQSDAYSIVRLMNNYKMYQSILKMLLSNNVSILWLEKLKSQEGLASEVFTNLKINIYNLVPTYISFALADQIYCLFYPSNKKSLFRIAHIVGHFINRYCFVTGNTFMYVDNPNLFWSQLSIDDIALYDVVQQKNLVAILQQASSLSLVDYNSETGVVTPYYMFKANHMIINSFKNCLNQDILLSQHVSELTISDQQNKEIVLNKQQLKAINLSMQHNISIISGPPGSGKTTVIKGLLKIIEQHFHGPIVQLSAPTGRACSALADKTGHNASTLHSLFRWNPKIPIQEMLDAPVHGTYKETVLVIDEMSMVPPWVLAATLKLFPCLRHIVLIGDVNQIPAVEPGNLFADIIRANVFPITYLNHNYRQEASLEISELAQKVINQDFSEEIDFGNAIEQIEVTDSQSILTNVEKIYEHLEQTAAVNCMNDVQIIAPLKKRGAGIEIINSTIQKMVNPVDTKTFLKLPLSNQYVGPNDKIMHIKNNTLLNVFNGDIGKVRKVKHLAEKSNMQDWCIEAQYPPLLSQGKPRIVRYKRSDLSELRLAYAITVHKSQGSEYKHVILILDRLHKILINRELIYTAISRASEKLYLVGSRVLLSYAAHNSMPVRNTLLKKLLQDSL